MKQRAKALVKKSNEDLPVFIYRAAITAVGIFGMWYCRFLFEENQEARKDRADISSSLAVVVTKLQELQNSSNSIYTASQAKADKAEVERRLTGLEERLLFVERDTMTRPHREVQ